MVYGMSFYLLYCVTMGGGMSSESIQNQESYVRNNLDAHKQRMSQFKNYDGSSRYTDNQIKMKLRQDYNSNGYIQSRIDKDSYISYSDWKAPARKYYN